MRAQMIDLFGREIDLRGLALGELMADKKSTNHIKMAAYPSAGRVRKSSRRSPRFRPARTRIFRSSLPATRQPFRTSSRSRDPWRSLQNLVPFPDALVLQEFVDGAHNHGIVFGDAEVVARAPLRTASDPPSISSTPILIVPSANALPLATAAIFIEIATTPAAKVAARLKAVLMFLPIVLSCARRTICRTLAHRLLISQIVTRAQRGRANQVVTGGALTSPPAYTMGGKRCGTALPLQCLIISQNAAARCRVYHSARPRR